MLFNSVSIFNGVSYITVQSNTKGSNVFIGRAIDLECNEYMIGIIMQQRLDKWKTYISDKPKLKSSVRHKWMRGFALGISSKLRELTKMKESKIQEYGLVPVSLHLKALEEYMTEHSGIKTTPGKRTNYLKSGFEAGKDTHIHKGLGKKTGTKLIGA